LIYFIVIEEGIPNKEYSMYILTHNNES